MFTSDVIKARNVHIERGNVIYHKFSHGPAYYTLNGKNVNIMFEFYVKISVILLFLLPLIYIISFLMIN